MIKNSISAILLLVCISSFGQEIQLSKDTVSNKKQSKYKYQSIDHYDQRLVFKLGAFSGFGISDPSSLLLSADLFAIEYKLSNTLSIEGTYYFPDYDIHALSGKLRYYLPKSQKANNLSGKYLAVEYARVLSGSGSDSYLGSFDTYFIQFGNQIKKSQFGYADIQVYSSLQRTSFGNYLNFGLNFRLGLSWGPLGPRNESLETNDLMFSDSGSWLFTVDNPFLVMSNTFDAVGTAVSAERELFITGLTARAQFSYAFSEQSVNTNFIRSSSFGVSGELRKYFGTIGKRGFEKAQIPFSGIYVGTGVSNWYVRQDINTNFTDSTPERFEYRGSERQIPFLGIGYQERLGKRYFFNVFATYQFDRIVNFTRNIRGGNLLSIGTRVGFAWGR